MGFDLFFSLLLILASTFRLALCQLRLRVDVYSADVHQRIERRRILANSFLHALLEHLVLGLMDDSERIWVIWVIFLIWLIWVIWLIWLFWLIRLIGLSIPHSAIASPLVCFITLV